MNEHKTPEQIAREALETHFIGVRTEVADAALVAWMVTAIEADRAQRSAHIDSVLLDSLVEDANGYTGEGEEFYDKWIQILSGEAS